MISFECDYSEGAHTNILDALYKSNYEQLPAYGNDIYSISAKEKIRKYFYTPNADVYFLTGGTQTNQVVIDSVVSSYQGVICADTGHINVHESGAIEYSGHKVISLPSHCGKLCIAELKSYLESFFNDNTYEHMVIPGMVYISYPTEYGTLYSNAELKTIKSICKDYNLVLYIDGARLGYGLNAMHTDVSAKDIAFYADVFYIGGTKVGALCGEAVVFSGIKAPKHFISSIKQHGAMVAKGRLIGIQFDALFTDGLYDKLSIHAVNQAKRLIEIVNKYGYKFFIDSPTNQQFVIIDDKRLKELSKYIVYSYWEKYDDNQSVIRLATSWYTTDEMLYELDQAFSRLI